MTIRIICAACQTSHALEDRLRGKKVRCRSCEKLMTVPVAMPSEELDEENSDQERPAKKKKKKKASKSGSPVLILGIAAVAIILVLGVGGVSAFLWWRSNNTADHAKAPNKATTLEPIARNTGQPQPQPKENDGGKIQFAQKEKGGKSLAGGIRQAAYITERSNELRQVGLFFQQYANDVPNPNSRKLEDFLNSFKQQAPTIYNNFKEKDYYRVNLQASLSSGSSIVAWETEPYAGKGYLCVRGDTSVDFVPEQEFKAAPGMP